MSTREDGHIPSDLRNESVGSLADLITPPDKEITTRIPYCTSDTCRGRSMRVQKFNAGKCDAVCRDCDHVLFWEVVRVGRKTGRMSIRRGKR